MSCTVIIPAAGDSARFKKATRIPKGIIRFDWASRKGLTMIEHVIPKGWIGRVLVACRSDQWEAFRASLPKSIDVIGVGESTDGQAHTVSIATEALSEDEDFLVINSDNAINGMHVTLHSFTSLVRSSNAEVGAVVFDPQKKNESRYGYVNDWPRFAYGTEKRRPSVGAAALAGVFYFRRGAEYRAARMAVLAERRNVAGSVGEHYISEMFAHFKSPKVAYKIMRANLHEWGTADQLIADLSVSNIQWGG